MIIGQDAAVNGAINTDGENRHVEKCHTAARKFPVANITTASIDGVTYIVEHETSRTARETPLEKIRKLILRDAETLHKHNGR